MFVVTFYSYKGGVGRTSALMNTAFRLARMGKRVFVLDFDLEAPGIDSFDFARSKMTRPGLVEYIGRFIDSNEVAPIDEFVFDISQPKSQGSVLMMPAGRKDENYQALMSRLDWKFLYRQKSGFLFVENLKAAIREKYAPDYVLIDSRTGLTDVSGICTLQLPDAVVLLFSLNNQNVNGTSQIYNSIRFNKLNRSVKTLLVASPIPDVPQSIEIRRERFENARKCIGAAPDLILPFDPFMAFQETIAGDSQSQALMKGYDELTTLVIGSNATDTLTLLREARRLTDVGNAELAELKYREILETRPDSWEAWTNFGIFQRTRGRPTEAADCFRKAIDLAPNSVRAIAQMSSTALDLDRIEEAKEYAKRLIDLGGDADELKQLGARFQRRGLPDAAYGAYRRAAELSPNQDTFFSWGEASMALGSYEEALKAYEKSMREQPSQLASVYNTAYAAEKLGRPEAGQLFRKAVELFERQAAGASDANALAAMAFAYTAINRPDKALRQLRSARRKAASADAPTFFSPTKYTHIPKGEFLAEVDSRIQEIEKNNPQLLGGEPAPTILTALKSQGEFVLTFKTEAKARRYTLRNKTAVIDLLTSIGMDAASARRYSETIDRGHPVQQNVDIDPDLIFGVSD